MNKNVGDDQKRRLIEEWDASGQSAMVFAEPRGIHPVTLRAWGREIRGRLRKPSQKRSVARAMARDVRLVELQGSESEPGQLRVELVLGERQRLVVTGPLTSEMLAELAVAFGAIAG